MYKYPRSVTVGGGGRCIVTNCSEAACGVVLPYRPSLVYPESAKLRVKGWFARRQ